MWPEVLLVGTPGPWTDPLTEMPAPDASGAGGRLLVVSMSRSPNFSASASQGQLKCLLLRAVGVSAVRPGPSSPWLTFEQPGVSYYIEKMILKADVIYAQPFGLASASQ